jgi:ribonuclease J
VYADLKGSRDGFEKQVMAACAGSMVGPEGIAADPGRYICCFSFFDVKHLLDIGTTGGLYLYSSSEAHDEEQRIDFVRLNNWLLKFNFTVAGFSFVNSVYTPDRNFHASGHASAKDILGIISAINPETVMPVHTDKPSFFADNVTDREVVLPENGTEYLIT